jgi:hypothetical protein
MAIVLDAKYHHEWFGDSWYGPGSVEISVDATLKKGYVF